VIAALNTREMAPFESTPGQFSLILVAIFLAKSCDGDGSKGEEEMGVMDPHKGVVTGNGDGEGEDEDVRMMESTNAMITGRQLRQMKEAHVSLTTAHLVLCESRYGATEDVWTEINVARDADVVPATFIYLYLVTHEISCKLPPYSM
jgi:hypothetical protein